jgi:hypothetical protein
LNIVLIKNISTWFKMHSKRPKKKLLRDSKWKQRE